MAAEVKKDKNDLVRHLPCVRILQGLWERDGCSPPARTELLLVAGRIQGFNILQLIHPGVQVPGHRVTYFPAGPRLQLKDTLRLHSASFADLPAS